MLYILNLIPLEPEHSPVPHAATAPLIQDAASTVPPLQAAPTAPLQDAPTDGGEETNKQDEETNKQGGESNSNNDAEKTPDVGVTKKKGSTEKRTRGAAFDGEMDKDNTATFSPIAASVKKGRTINKPVIYVSYTGRPEKQSTNAKAKLTSTETPTTAAHEVQMSSTPTPTGKKDSTKKKSKTKTPQLTASKKIPHDPTTNTTRAKKQKDPNKNQGTTTATTSAATTPPPADTTSTAARRLPEAASDDNEEIGDEEENSSDDSSHESESSTSHEDSCNLREGDFVEETDGLSGEEEEKEVDTDKLEVYIEEDHIDVSFDADAFSNKDNIEQKMITTRNTCVFKFHFLSLTFMIHATNRYLVCQPRVNHRNLSLLVVNDTLIPAATQDKSEGLGFEEQTYGIIYQVVNKNDPLASRGVPLYCTYTTLLSPVKPPEVEDQVAIFPTRQGILKLLQYFKLTALINEYYKTTEYNKDEPFLPIDLVRKLFKDPAFLKMADSSSVFQESDTTKNLPAKQKRFSIAKYREQKMKFQSAVTIRFGMLGGLHRTGTSCFFFLGEEPKAGQEMRVPRTMSASSSTSYLSLSPDMKINIESPLTIILPKTPEYTDEYIKQCNAYSYHVEERQPKSVKMTYKSLSI